MFLLHDAKIVTTKACKESTCRFRHVVLSGITQADMVGRAWNGALRNFPSLISEIQAAGREENSRTWATRF